MRRFVLNRVTDATGVSGTGIVAEGVMWGDGTCALRWRTASKSTAVYECMADLETIHGHNGDTRIEFVDEDVVMFGGNTQPFERGRCDAIQDRCENCPFASVGGKESRDNMRAPKYIPQSDAAEYLRGYAHQARILFGDDWQTCEFEWVHAMTIGDAAGEQGRGGGNG